MATLKVDDKVKVKDGEESNSSHTDVAGTVKAVTGTAVSVVFDGVNGIHTYEANQLEKQK